MALRGRSCVRWTAAAFRRQGRQNSVTELRDGGFREPYLARLPRNTNRRDEARTMLANIYNWFTEGFDRRLESAETLLEELA